jgi:autotransporter-associated beta strand protein
MKPKNTLRNLLALAGSSLIAMSSASGQNTYTWANSNVTGTPPANLDWFGAGQGTWIGGDPVSSNLNTIQFFENTSTQLLNTASPQSVNLNNGGTAFQLGTLTLSGRGAANSGTNLTMNLEGDALNFSAATGTVNLNAVNSSRSITYNVANNIQLGTASSGSVLTFTGNGSSSFNFTGNISELQTGGGSLVKSGNSTVVLSGTNNTYSGGTTISSGTLEGRKDTEGGDSPFGTGTIQLNGGTLRLRTLGDGGNTPQTITFGNDVIVGGNATINFTRFGGSAANKTHALGNLSIGSDTLTITGNNIGHFLSFTGANLTGDAVINTSSGAFINTKIGAITETGGSRGLTKEGTGTLELLGANTYTGNTTVTAGTLTLADSSSMQFQIGANQVNNAILGSGTLNLNGLFFFDLTSASINSGNFWQIVDVGTLTETYGSTFGVSSTLGNFSDNAGVWSLVNGDNTWTFTQDTGILNLAVIPEPTTALLGGLGLLALLRRRR